jgi:hypothetical protein
MTVRFTGSIEPTLNEAHRSCLRPSSSGENVASSPPALIAWVRGEYDRSRLRLWRSAVGVFRFAERRRLATNCKLRRTGNIISCTSIQMIRKPQSPTKDMTEDEVRRYYRNAGWSVQILMNACNSFVNGSTNLKLKTGPACGLQRRHVQIIATANDAEVP